MSLPHFLGVRGGVTDMDNFLVRLLQKRKDFETRNDDDDVVEDDCLQKDKQQKRQRLLSEHPLSLAEQSTLFELRRKHEGNALLHGFEINGFSPEENACKKRELIIALQQLEIERLTQLQRNMEMQAREFHAAQDKIRLLEQSAQSVQKVVSENREYQTLIFKLNQEKTALDERAADLEKRLARQADFLSREFQRDVDALKNRAAERLDTEHLKFMEWVNKTYNNTTAAAAEKEQGDSPPSLISPHDLRDKLIMYMENVRLLIARAH